MGQTSHAYGNNSLALGTNSTAYANNTIAIGQEAGATGVNAIALGTNSTANGIAGVSLGQASSAVGNNSVAIGQNSLANRTNAIALGANATTTTGATQVASVTQKNITFGNFAGQVSDAGMQVSVGSAGAERQLKNVGSGSISATSTDAINGSQLYATNNALGNTANSLVPIIGGNTVLNPDGSISTGNIGNTGKNSIHEAIAAAKTKVSQGKNIKVTPTINSDGSTTYEVATQDDVTFNSINVGPVTINQAGINAGNTKIINISKGDISSTSKDAVNGSQLHNVGDTIYNIIGAGADFDAGQGPTFIVTENSYYTIGDAIDALDREDKRLDKDLEKASKWANAGIASAMALEPAPHLAGKWTYAIGAAHHSSETGFGTNLRKTADNGRWSMTIGVTGATAGLPGVRFGMSGVIN
nr:hypothetical protein [Acinetobacter equi]